MVFNVTNRIIYLFLVEVNKINLKVMVVFQFTIIALKLNSQFVCSVMYHIDVVSSCGVPGPPELGIEADYTIEG